LNEYTVPPSLGNNAGITGALMLAQNALTKNALV